MKRPRRWRREVTVRDRFGAVHCATIPAQFDACVAELARFTDLSTPLSGFEWWCRGCEHGLIPTRGSGCD
ncbi:MAG: hypothetical protein ABIR68_08290 [Ilumatobacteraceae bacterium]